MNISYSIQLINNRYADQRKDAGEKLIEYFSLRPFSRRAMQELPYLLCNQVSGHRLAAESPTNIPGESSASLKNGEDNRTQAREENRTGNREENRTPESKFDNESMHSLISSVNISPSSPPVQNPNHLLDNHYTKRLLQDCLFSARWIKTKAR